MKEEHIPILGTLNKDGRPEKWPRLNINGGRYQRPVSTTPISDEFFVVIPAGFSDWDRVKALKDEYANQPAPKIKVSAGTGGKEKDKADGTPSL